MIKTDSSTKQSGVDFVKMHGLGNDFVVFQGPLHLGSEQIARLCHRQYGIGADGLLVISPLENNQVRMEYWNADGSTAEMCGNGLRCVVRFAVDAGFVRPGKFVVQTPAGSRKVMWDSIDATKIEVQVGKVTTTVDPVQLEGLTFYEANVGNPHAITFVDDVQAAPVTTLGPEIETNQHFPNKTNVEFAQIVDKQRISLRIWERGVGETLACGTGMVSTAVVAAEQQLTTLPVTLVVPGGEANIWIDSEGFACILGPAERVFSGRIMVE